MRWYVSKNYLTWVKTTEIPITMSLYKPKAFSKHGHEKLSPKTVIAIGVTVYLLINSCIASRDFCRLQITFTNSLDPDQGQQDVHPDLDPHCYTLIQILKQFF